MRSKICIAILTVGLICLIVGFEGNIQEKKNLRTELATIQAEATSLQDVLNQKEEDLQKKTEKNKELKSELKIANQTIEDLKDSEYKLVYLGDFRLTHYCSELRPHICGYGKGITATGTKATVGRTVAVDPKKIPYGTRIYIEGYGWRTAEDCGPAVKNNQIDILVNTHEQALNLGTRTGGVWILVKNS